MAGAGFLGFWPAGGGSKSKQVPLGCFFLFFNRCLMVLELGFGFGSGVIFNLTGTFWMITPSTLWLGLF